MRNFETYRAARDYYMAGNSAIVSPRAPLSKLSKSARRFMFGGALCIMAAAMVRAPAVLEAAHQVKEMAAVGAWAFYNEAKKYIAVGDIDLNASTFRMTLHTSASNANTATLSTYASVTGEVTEANGYSSSGKAISYIFTVGTSAGQYKMSAAPIIWTATGGTLPNVKFAVIWVSSSVAGQRRLLMRSQLSTGQFTVTTGNTITISPGIAFTLA